MSSVNKVILIGNMGADPEIRHTNDGRPIANFSLATSEKWKDKATGETRERTEWHRVVIFSEALVRVVENYLRKGSKIYLEGQIATREWQDQKGVDRYTTEIILQGYNAQLVMLDRRETGPGAAGDASAYGMDADRAAGTSTAKSTAMADDMDDEIPF